ncbi:hypothetical protein [Streptomyces sp. NPDC012510]|uniref:hypothetical protein n=1 Tax=Streptomyces sp. NPDC012510 TaxID=3364838 RepID=UPI0036F05F7D
MTRTVDLWHRYGRTRHTTDRAVPDRFFWDWGQDGGPGAELVGNVTSRCVGDLGAGRPGTLPIWRSTTDPPASSPSMLRPPNTPWPATCTATSPRG